MTTIYHLFKRGGEIAVTTMITILFILNVASIIVKVRGGAAEASFGAYQSLAENLVKTFFIIVVAVTVAAGFIYAIFTRR